MSGRWWMLVAATCFFASIFTGFAERPLWMIAGALFVIAGRLGEET